MAEAVSVKNHKSELTCSICQKTVDNMVLSSCFHTFCPDCLQGHTSTRGGKGAYSQYECPICKTKINIDSTTFKDLPFREDGVSPAELGYAGRSTSGYNYCDICSGGKLAVNRCLQCLENFCESCTNAHVKMKASRYHSQRVVPLRDMSLFEYSDKTQTYCPRHRNERIIVICRQCDVFLCLVCKLLEHEGHVTKLVSEEANEVRNNLATILQRQTGFSESLQMNIHTLEENKSQYPKTLEHELTKIQYQTSKLHLQIEKDKTDKERELIGHYGNFITRNDRSYETLREDHTNYKILSQQAQQLIYSNNDLETIRKGRRIRDKLAQMEADGVEFEDERPSQRFVGGNINEEQINKMVGQVNKYRTTPRRDIRFETQVSNETRADSAMSTTKQKRTSTSQLQVQPVSRVSLPYEDGIGYVYGIAPTANNCAWVVMLDHSDVTLVDVEGHIIKKIDAGEPCDGIASDFNGGCYVTCPRSKSVKHIQPTEEISTVCMDLIQNPHGISVVRDHNGEKELYVCCTDTTSSLYDQPTGGVIRVFTDNGEELAKSFSVQSPVRLDIDPDTGHLCVSDHSNGCVMVMDTFGQQVKALYTGEDEEELFRPLGVCFDATGCVLIADWKNDQVLRINTDGQLKQTLLTELDGPQTVMLDTDTLWVGCKQGGINVYKIHA